MGVEIFVLVRRNFELLAAQLFFVCPAVKKRDKVSVTVLLAGFALLCVIGVFGNMLVEYLRSEFIDGLGWEINALLSASSLIIYFYYLLMDVLTIVLLAVYSRLTIDKLLFFSLAGHSADMIKGVAFYFADAATIGSMSAIAGDVPALVVYSVVRFVAVFAIDFIIYFIVGRKWCGADDVRIVNKRVSAAVYAAMIALIFITNNMAAMLFYSTPDVTRYIGVFILAFTCVFMLIMLYAVHLNNKQRLESQITKRLMIEREKQFAQSKENIDVINRKCHDLKHQISALKLATEKERNSSIAELEKSVMIYDAVLNTGNEILDTILTEKTFFCRQNDIELTCFIDARIPESISTVDLYVMLGNALDNAVEAVKKYDDASKRVIGLSIVGNGALMTIEVNNYSAEKPRLADGLPVTTKADENYHGFGIRSIRTIARKYGGDIDINYANEIFDLKIGIPLP